MKKIFIVLGVLILAAVFLYPKEWVVGGWQGGPIPEGVPKDTQMYSCFGVKYNYCPGYPDYGCDRLCFGIVHSKKCVSQTYKNGVLSEEDAPCLRWDLFHQ